ncbi:MAG: galactokinase family protein [Candidatus Thorarchaeota archaeon]
MKPFRVRAPGRLCLFGEHSDYIGLDVIPAAIGMNIEILAYPRDDSIVTVDYKDLNETDEFILDKPIRYRNHRDYLRSAFNVLAREGAHLESGLDLIVEGDIPIAGGLSSSSALSIAAVMTAAYAGDKELSREQLARLAHKVEVVEFGESGGMQDHFASAYGGIIHLDLGNDYRVTKLPAKLGKIVIGDSGEKKEDTVGDIRYIKITVETEYQRMGHKIKNFDRRTTSLNEVYGLQRSRPNKNRRMAEATLRNRDLTGRARGLLSKEKVSPKKIGELLKEHHEILRDGLDRSTPKIERMINAAYESGALGCKINGSGGGGTMMAYCDGWEREVASAIVSAGGTSYIVERGRRATLSKIK